MTETIITENGEVKIQEQQDAPAPIKTGLAHMLRSITHHMDLAEEQLILNQAKLDRICSQLTDVQWATLAGTQVRIIAVRNADAAAYLLRTK